MYEQPFNPFAKNLAVVKDYFKSGSVLALAVVRGIIVVLTVITALIGSASASSIMNSLSKTMSELDLPAEFTESWNSIASQSASSTTSILSYIPSIAVSLLVVAALLIIYFKSRNSSPEASPKAGVTILYILAIISMVAMIIAAVISVLGIGVLIWAVATQAGSQSGSTPIRYTNPTDGKQYQISVDAGLATVFVAVIAVFFIIFMVIALIYVVNTKRYYGSIRASISTVELQNRGAKAYGVFNVIFAVISGLGLLSIPTSFISIATLHLDGMGIVALVIDSLTKIAAFAALVLEAKIALGYKKYIDEVKYGYSRPVPPAAPYAPFPTQGYNPPQVNNYQNPGNSFTPNANTYADPYGAAPAPKPQAAPVCPKCGAPTDPNAPYCGNCGNKL